MEIANAALIILHLIAFIFFLANCLAWGENPVKSLIWSTFLGLTPVLYFVLIAGVFILAIAFIGYRNQIKESKGR